MACLVGKAEDGTVVRIDLPKSGEAILGRSPERANVIVSAPSVSGCHCSMVQTDGVWILKDLGSTNGTRLNGKKISEAKVSRGDTVSLGDFSLVFESDCVSAKTGASDAPGSKIEKGDESDTSAAAEADAGEPDEQIESKPMKIEPMSANSPTVKVLPSQFKKKSAHTRKWVTLIAVFALVAVFLIVLFIRTLR